MKTKRITITDIAEKSGYSKTAVSFAFNCPSRISREACEKILAVAPLNPSDYLLKPVNARRILETARRIVGE